MNKRRIEIQSFIMKSIVLVISMCYLLGPIREEISSILHLILHTIEMPDQVLTHDDFQIEEKYREHTSYEHKPIQKTHNHKTLSFIKELISTINDDSFSNDEVPLEKLTHYKHINDEHIGYDDVVYNLWIVNKTDYPSEYQKTKKGYDLTPKEPPRSII